MSHKEANIPMEAVGNVSNGEAAASSAFGAANKSPPMPRSSLEVSTEQNVPSVSKVVRKDKSRIQTAESLPRCCQSRKLRDNYQTLFGAVSLILVGLGALCGGIYLQVTEGGSAGVMLYIFSVLCIIPGGYYTGVVFLLWTRRTLPNRL